MGSSKAKSKQEDVELTINKRGVVSLGCGFYIDTLMDLAMEKHNGKSKYQNSKEGRESKNAADKERKEGRQQT